MGIKFLTDGDSEELERRAWDDEVGGVEDQEEDASWRVERFEREKWKHEAEKVQPFFIYPY